MAGSAYPTGGQPKHLGLPGWQRDPQQPPAARPTQRQCPRRSGRLLGRPAGSAAGPPGRAPGDPGQGGLAAQAWVEEVEGADLAGAELVVVDRLVVPAA